VAARNAVDASPLSAEVTPTQFSGGGAGLLSPGPPATASSGENGNLAAVKAFGGNNSTRWSSAFSDPRWIQVDLAVTGSGRYVRMYGTQHATQYGYSLLEFQVYGT
jgi:hypothetical protein